jgi:hypothetical protein
MICLSSTIFPQLDSIYNININHLTIPVRADGLIGFTYQNNSTDAVFYDDIMVIWSAGFLLSGYSNGTLWSNGNASAARVEDYVPGPVGEGFKGLFVVKSSDNAFGESWQNWKEAVDLGAYYYDGDKDGEYDPVDKNSNGIWDLNEDKPDILGDVTVWGVYNDGVPSSERKFPDSEPQGIEIRQTVWTYEDEGSNGNAFFVRYSIVNKGTVSETLDSVYFGAWSDTDIGYYMDDLGGTDIELNSVFIYNDSIDTDLGISSLAHYMSLMQRPWETVNNSNLKAYNNKGSLLGIDTINNAVNLKMSSSNQILKYVDGHKDPATIEMARNLLKGLTSLDGNIIDPCNWQYGSVFGIDCESVPVGYIYSGNPMTNTGWINTNPTDTRMLANVGPFTLIKDQPKDIIVSNVITREDNYMTSLEESKKIAENLSVSFVTDINNTLERKIPLNLSLEQNYPNPFNPSTVIHYRIPAAVDALSNIEVPQTFNGKRKVTLKVYDILGREIATLVNEEQNPGNYEVTFNGKDFNSGVYFYELRVGSFRSVKKMMLVK